MSLKDKFVYECLQLCKQESFKKECIAVMKSFANTAFADLHTIVYLVFLCITVLFLMIFVILCLCVYICIYLEKIINIVKQKNSVSMI